MQVLLADSKILLVEKSRISLLNELTRLSAFDYRSYIRNLLKRFMRVGGLKLWFYRKSFHLRSDFFFVCTLYCGLCLFFQDELNEIVKMDALAKVAAAEADLLLEEEKKPQSKKKKHRSNKVLDKTVEP